jgi:hypothetical protein
MPDCKRYDKGKYDNRNSIVIFTTQSKKDDNGNKYHQDFIYRKLVLAKNNTHGWGIIPSATAATTSGTDIIIGGYNYGDMVPPPK